MIALLSDIHGNADALHAVLKDAHARGAESLLVAGDYVGYYYQPDRVFEMLDCWNWIGVRGNHDDMFGGWLAGEDREDLLARYGHGLAEATKRLSNNQIKRLAELPPRRDLKISGRSVILAHGAPDNPDEYIYPDASILTFERLLGFGADLVILGHSHYPYVHEWHGQLVVNPGSVGQPRDRLPGASWALWDPSQHTVMPFRTNYDATEILRSARFLDPNLPYLVDVLVRKNEVAT